MGSASICVISGQSAMLRWCDDYLSICVICGLRDVAMAICADLRYLRFHRMRCVMIQYLESGTGTGVPAPRPSGPPPATQRRPIGVVARRAIGGLRPRRWHAGGLLPNRESRPSSRSPWIARQRHCADRVALLERGSEHNSVPGTSRWRRGARVLSSRLRVFMSP